MRVSWMILGALLVAGSVLAEEARSLNETELKKLRNRDRPHLEFFGATIYADKIEGTEAKGNVFVDGAALNETNEAFPIFVYADRITVDLAGEKIVISGWPLLEWTRAYIRGQSAKTAIHLTRTKYRVEGPAQIGIKP